MVWEYEYHKTLLKKSVEILDTFEFITLKKTYRLLYANWNGVMTMSESYEKYTDIAVLNDHYSSDEFRNSRSALITAYRVISGGQTTEYRDIGMTARPREIKYFLKHVIFIGKECYGHWFANIQWFYPVTDDLKYKLGKPTEIWHFLNNSEQHLLYQYLVYCQNLFMLHLNIRVKR